MPRHPFVLTPEDRLLVRELAAIGMSEQDIATQLSLPLPKLQKEFRRELHQGAATGREHMLKKLHAIALSGENLNALTFCVKSRCGWRDTGSVQNALDVVRFNRVFRRESDRSRDEQAS